MTRIRNTKWKPRRLHFSAVPLLTPETLLADLRHALRLLLRYPGFTAAAVVALALAIGANLTVFTLANAFLFKNLPFDDSGRIVYVSGATAARPGVARGVSYPDFVDYRSQAKSVVDMAAMSTCSVDVSDGRGFAERYRCAQLTPNAFRVIGQQPIQGRDFRDDDAVRGAPPVAIIGYGVWQARYGADATVVGKTIRVNDVPTTIIGIMAKGMTFPGASDLWLPLVQTDAMRRRGSRTLTMFGRMLPHTPLSTVRSEMNIVASRLATTYPESNKDVGVLVQNFNDRFNGGQTTIVLVWLLWAVAFVLVIACANVANLLLARAVGRSREMSIRASLGASRGRVVQQLLVESAVLAAISAALGWLLGVWGVQVFDAALVPAVKPPHIDFSIDYHVIAYLVAITVATTLAFGLVPALQLSALDINSTLKDGGNAAGQGRAARALSTVLVVAEVSLAVVLLAGAGVMVRSLLNTSRADIGIESSRVLSMNLNLRAQKYPGVGTAALFYDRLKDRLQALPGIDAAAIASDLPAESPDVFTFEVEGAPGVAATSRPRAAGLIVGEDYFRVMGVAPREGREFSPADAIGGNPVVIVSDMLAKQAWRGQAAVGKRLRILSSEDAPTGEGSRPAPWLTVVGVVSDILQDDESFELAPVVYLPYRQHPQRGMEVVVRTTVAPGGLGETIRREVQQLDPDLAVRTLRPLEESLWLRNWRQRVFGSMFAIFAAIALVLASVGLYAVIAHSVSLRTREFGVRRTLGASGSNIMGLVMRRGMFQLVVGLVIGLAGAVSATRVLEALLVGVDPADPTTLLVSTALLAFAGLLGCAVPARRAIRVDPVIVLRQN